MDRLPLHVRTLHRWEQIALVIAYLWCAIALISTWSNLQ